MTDDDNEEYGEPETPDDEDQVEVQAILARVIETTKLAGELVQIIVAHGAAAMQLGGYQEAAKTILAAVEEVPDEMYRELLTYTLCLLTVWEVGERKAERASAN